MSFFSFSEAASESFSPLYSTTADFPIQLSSGIIYEASGMNACISLVERLLRKTLCYENPIPWEVFHQIASCILSASHRRANRCHIAIERRLAG